MPVDALPDELLVECFRTLSVASSLHALRVSTRWRRVVNTAWRERCNSRWPATAQLNVLNHIKFYAQRAWQMQMREYEKTDYTMLVDGSVDSKPFSLAMPLAAAAADGGMLIWPSPGLTWQQGTVPTIVLSSVAVWREPTQQISTLYTTMLYTAGHHAGIHGSAETKIGMRNDEVFDSWRNGSSMPFHLLKAEFGKDFFEYLELDNEAEARANNSFLWRLHYLNGSLSFSVVERLGVDLLDEPDASEEELGVNMEMQDEDFMLKALDWLCSA